MNEIYDNDNRFSAMQPFFNKYRTILISSVIAFIVAFGISFSLKTISKINDEKAAIVFNEWSDFLSEGDVANAEKSFDSLMTSFSKTGYAKIALLDSATKEELQREMLKKMSKLVVYDVGESVSIVKSGDAILVDPAKLKEAMLIPLSEDLDVLLVSPFDVIHVW